MTMQFSVQATVKDRQGSTQAASWLANHHHTVQRIGRGILIALVVLCLSLTALAQQTTSSPTIVSRAWLTVQSIDGTFSELMVVMEFAPGAGVAPHTHGGPTLVTVLEGEITLN